MGQEISGPVGTLLEYLSDGVAIYREGMIVFANESFRRLGGVDCVPLKIPHHELLEKLGIPTDAKGGGELCSSRRYSYYSFPADGDTEEGVFLVLRLRDLLRAIDENFANNPFAEECIRFMVHNPYEGMNIVDREGRILYMSPTHEKFFGISPQGAIGRHVKDIIENTRLHIVAKTGVAEVGKTQMMQGHERIVARIPLRRGNEVVGAIGKVMFKDLHQLKLMAREVEILKERITDIKGKLVDIYSTRYSLKNLVGESESTRKIREIVLQATENSLPVLITGESGTGKELVAQAIHSKGNRAAPFVPVNCSAIPEPLVESELFGYEKGAFTGADKAGHIGKFELAEGGTVFLDEIGDMPVGVQTKLLRVLQEGEIQRVGGIRCVRVNFRLISATNSNLRASIASNRFREDLFYRINTIHIHIPPLRERPEDIPLLIAHIMSRFPEKFGVAPQGIHPDAMTLLEAYQWPGNVRELSNVIEWSGNLAGGGEIQPRHLPLHIINMTFGSSSLQDKKEISLLRDVVRHAEVNAINRALKMTNGNRSNAAKMLGIHRSELYRKLLVAEPTNE